MALTLRKLMYALFAVVLIGAVAVFAYLNPDPIAVDVGFARYASVSLALFAVCVFVIGWLAGLLAAGLALLRMAGERKRAQRELKLAEAELRALRSLPMQDAN